MALINNPYMYTGGAVRLDSTPSVNLYAQLKQRQQAQEAAKNEAFDEYIRGLNTKINPAGKRTVDDPAFKHFYDKWQQFGLQNKDALRKGDVPAQSEFNARYQEMLNFIQESKQAEEKKKPLVEVLLDKSKRASMNPNAMKAIAAHDEPLYIQDKSGEYVRNPNRKDFDYTQDLYVPEIDYAKQYEKWSKGYKMDEDAGGILRRDPITGTAIREYTYSFSPDTKKQIAINAANDAAADPKVGSYYQYRFEKLKDSDFDELNKIYQQTFGKKTNLGGGIQVDNYIDSPEKLAAAEALREANVVQKKEKEIRDAQLAFQRAQVNINLNRTGSAPSASLADYDVFGRYSNKQKQVEVTNKVKNPSGWGTVNETAVVDVVPYNEVDVNDKKLIGEVPPVTDPKTKERYYIVRDDGDWEGANKQVISRANAARKNMDATTISEEKRGRLSDDIVPNQGVRLPKKITNTKMQPKKDPLNLGL